MLPVCVDGKFGYINVHGEVVVPCQYDYASEFSEGMATVRIRFNDDDYTKQEYIIINDDRCEVGRLVCANCGKFSDGLMDFEREDKYGFVDTSLQVVIPPSFSLARDFVDGLTTAEGKRGGGWGVIDHSGQWRIPPKYQYLWSFKRGERVTAFSLDRENWGLLDRNGEVVAEPRFSHICVTSNGLTPAGISMGTGKKSKYGFIDESGEWVVSPRFDLCSGFADETIGAMIGGRWGVVNREGAWIIEPRFTYAEAFHEDLSKVYIGGSDDGMWYSGGKCGYIDRDGEFVVEPIFDDAWPFENGIARVMLVDGDPEEIDNRRMGYINHQGHYIWKPT